MYLWPTNIVFGIFRLSFSKTVFHMNELVKNIGRRSSLLTRWERGAVMAHISRKCIRTGARDLDPWLGIGATAKVCPVQRQHCNSTGRGSNGACVEKLIPSLVMLFSRQKWIRNLAKVMTVEVKNAAMLYLKYSTGAQSSSTVISWRTSTVSVVVQWFPFHETPLFHISAAIWTCMRRRVTFHDHHGQTSDFRG